MSVSLEALLLGLTLLFYFSAAVCYHLHLFAGSERGRSLARALVPAGLVVHTVALGVWCLTHRGSSILRDPGMPFSIVAFFVALAQVALSFRGRWAAMGSLSMALAFIAQFYAAAQIPGSPVDAPPGSALLKPHVMALLLGFAALTLAFCVAVIYLVQSRLLKRKQVKGLFSRLPPLDTVATAAHWLAAIGFSMLTLGIITGSIAAPQSFGAQWYLDAHTVIGFLAWAIYAAYIGASFFLGWRGRRTTYFLIAGYVVVLLSLVVSVARPRSTPHVDAAHPQRAPRLADVT
jgi:ABC-type uncharacterized transport system permease subunit